MLKSQPSEYKPKDDTERQRMANLDKCTGQQLRDILSTLQGDAVGRAHIAGHALGTAITSLRCSSYTLITVARHTYMVTLPHFMHRSVADSRQNAIIHPEVALGI